VEEFELELEGDDLENEKRADTCLYAARRLLRGVEEELDVVLSLLSLLSVLSFSKL